MKKIVEYYLLRVDFNGNLAERVNKYIDKWREPRWIPFVTSPSHLEPYIYQAMVKYEE